MRYERRQPKRRRDPVQAICLLVGLALLGPVLPVTAPPRSQTRPTIGLAPGRLLVASPGLADPNFMQTVVLLLKYGDDGAAGVIINRPAPILLSEAVPSQPGLEGREDQLHFGGPVGVDGLFLLFRGETSPAGGDEVLDHVWSVRDAEAITSLLAEKPPTGSLRAYAGYAGWAPGQLETEVARGDWYVYPASPNWIFEEEPITVWERLLERATNPIA